MGLSHLHCESITLHNDDFSTLLDTLEAHDIEPVIVEDYGHLDDVNALLISPPGDIPNEENCVFTDVEIQQFRHYLEHGGRVLILLRGRTRFRPFFDAHGSNFHALLPPDDQIIPNDDEIIDKRHHIKRDYQFIIHIPFHVNNIAFDGDVFFDGGCSFSMHGNFEHRFIPSNEYRSHRDDGNTLVTDPIFAIKKVGKGLVIVFGSRWAFSDDRLMDESNEPRFQNLTFLNHLLDLLFT